MLDKIGNELKEGDKVAILHKRYSSTTPTIQVGIVTECWKNICKVEVAGMRTTKHRQTSIVKIQ